MVTIDVLSPQSEWGCIPCAFCIQLPQMYSLHKVSGDVSHAPSAYSYHGCTLSTKLVGMYPMHLLHTVAMDVLSPQSQWGCTPLTFCIQSPWMYSLHKACGGCNPCTFCIQLSWVYSSLSLKSTGMYVSHSHHEVGRDVPPPSPKGQRGCISLFSQTLYKPNIDVL